MFMGYFADYNLPHTAPSSSPRGQSGIPSQILPTLYKHVLPQENGQAASVKKIPVWILDQGENGQGEIFKKAFQSH